MEQQLTLARPYANAAFDFAIEHNKLEFWLGFLNSAAIIAADKRVKRLFNNPNVIAEQIIDLFFAVLEKHIDDFGKNFLRLLAHYHRFDILPEINALFIELKAEHEKTANVKITSAFELTEVQKAKLVQALEKRLNLKVQAICETDENILGGAIIRAGNLVFDGSGRKRLNQLQEHLG